LQIIITRANIREIVKFSNELCDKYENLVIADFIINSKLLIRL